MSPSEEPTTTRVLVIGPLPPPYGGSRVSFERFLRYVENMPQLEVKHVDLPVLKRGTGGSANVVAPFATWLHGLVALGRIPLAERIVLFSSRGLAFSYGLVVIAVGRLFRRPVALRLFGGRPYAAAATRTGLWRRTTEWVLSLASTISLETVIGRNDLPESVRDHVKAIPGYRPRMKSPAPRRETSGEFRFAYAGRVDRTKGIDILLEAGDRLAERAHLCPVVIDCYGQASDEITQASEKHPNVRLMGVVDNQSYRARLASYDAFVYPTVYDNEGHPGALIEAMFAGLPIVCSALPTILEIVTDGVEGLTVEPGNAEALAEAMAMIAADRPLRDRLAVGSTLKSDAFDEDVVIPRLLREMHLVGDET